MEKKIEEANFNSTANLTSNKGFQSSLSISSSDEKNEKPYNPFEHRQLTHPNSTIGSILHLLKACLGSGILAMPAAFKNSGIVVGSIGTILAGFICTHTVGMLVRTSQLVCVDAKVPSMSFAETCGAAFTHGPKSLQPWGKFVKELIDYSVTLTYISVLCVYVVFIGSSFKEVEYTLDIEKTAALYTTKTRLRGLTKSAKIHLFLSVFKVLDVLLPDLQLSVQTYCVLTLVPLVLICQIRNLKYLVPFSALANALIAVVFVITMYYMFVDLPPLSEREMVADISQWPLFFSTVIFAMEGIGVVMPVENEMAKPQHFLGCPGVLNVAMIVVITLYGIFGFFGYLQYGDYVKGSITLNLPQDDMIAQAAKLLMAIVIYFSYPLAFYVPMEMITRQLNKRESRRFENVIQVGIRTLLVVISVGVAAAFPNLELVISFVGAIFFSTLGLLIPSVVETVYRWDRNTGRFNYVIYKNAIIGIISIIALVSGSYTSIVGIIDEFFVGHPIDSTFDNETLTMT